MDAEHNRQGMAQSNRSKAAQEGCVLGLVPIRRELIWGPDDDRVALKCERLRRLQPGPKRLFRELTAGAVQNARPYFVRRERHEDVDNSGEGGVRSYPSRVEKANHSTAGAMVRIESPRLLRRFM